MSSTWNRMLNLSIFGESHGPAIGMTLDHLPASEEIDLDELYAFTARRTAKKEDHTSTARYEADLPHIISGFYQGKTTGTPLTAIIENTNVRSKDYEGIEQVARPGHADYTGNIRYHGANDIRGGGHFSGRLTAPLTLAGGICKQILERRGVYIASHIRSIKDVDDASLDPADISLGTVKRLQTMDFPLLNPQNEEKMRTVIEKARLDSDSVGGIVECIILGLPAGIGSPMFGGIENVISSLVFGIPGVKGIEFGEGFRSSKLYGSENNDPFYIADHGSVKTISNHHGGILGGISSSMPIVFRTAFKPTPSIGRMQETVNITSMKNTSLAIEGRHDPCIAIRAAVVVEAAANIAVLDLMMEHGKITL